MTTLIVSHNEITMTCRKLFEALRFADGDYVDAADMVAWRELHGLAGLALVAADLDQLRDPYKKTLQVRRQQQILTELDGQGQSCLLVGALAADLGYQTAVREGTATISLYNCCHQSLLMAYLARVAQRGVSLLATWNENAGQTQVIAVFSAATPLPTLYHYHLDAAVTIPNPHTDWLHINYARDNALTFSADMAQQFTVTAPAALAATAQQHYQNGIPVDTTTWDTLIAVSKSILVAATAQSRQQGAGGS